MRSGRPRDAARTASKTLRAMFDITDQAGVTHSALARAAGRSPSMMSMYRSGGALPDILTTEAMVQALGYRIELVPIEKGERGT